MRVSGGATTDANYYPQCAKPCSIMTTPLLGLNTTEFAALRPTSFQRKERKFIHDREFTRYESKLLQAQAWLVVQGFGPAGLARIGMKFMAILLVG